jgi:NTE family protein
MDFRVRKPGLIGGERLARLLAAQLGDGDIKDLPRRFASVATDLTTGHEVWLTEGPLVDSIRASFALPGIFPPIQRGGRWLVDGSLVNPIPISVCLALGAHMVIAVNLNGDIMGKAKAPGASYPTVAGFDMLDVLDQSPQGWSGSLNGMVKRVFRRERDTPSLFGVMISSLNIVLDRVTRSRLAGEPPDVHIAPKLGRIGIAEFDRAAEMIAIGEEAARDALPDIVDAMSVFGIPGGPAQPADEEDGEDTQEGERAS